MNSHTTEPTPNNRQLLLSSSESTTRTSRSGKRERSRTLAANTTWTQKGSHNLTITNSNLIGTSTPFVIGQLLSTAKSMSYKAPSFLGSRTPANSSPLRLSNWRPWTKRSSNGDGKSSDSLPHSPLQSSPAPTSSSSQCQAIQSKPPNSDASGAVNTGAHAKPPSPPASCNELSTSRPTIPPTHKQQRRFSPLHSNQAKAHFGPTPSPKSMLTRDSPSANPHCKHDRTTQHHQLLPNTRPCSGSTTPVCPHHGR